MHATATTVSETSFVTLTERALDGDRDAWAELVTRLRRVVWKVVMSFDLAEVEREDAFAATFLRLYERLGDVREPEKLPGWIAAVARNEVHAILRSRHRYEVAVANSAAEPAAALIESLDASPDEESDVRVALRHAFASLPAGSQQLLRLLMAEVPYAEIAETLRIPIGRIGPTRQRCLEQLRRHPELAAHLRGAKS